jgi:(p)ppGpp synthase/HD superfamily hydrolase
MNPYYENTVIQLCSNYAAIAHKNQFRKDGITPYIVHPARTAALISKFDDNPLYVAAAWLHDVIEDQSEIVDNNYSHIIHNHNVNIDDFLTNNESIEKEHGTIILILVKNLTQNVNTTKKEYYQKLQDAGYHSTIIKYCDRIDNLNSLLYKYNTKSSKEKIKKHIDDTELLIDMLDSIVKKDCYKAQLMLQQILNTVKDKYNNIFKENII